MTKKIIVVAVIVILLLLIIPKLKGSPIAPDEWQIPLAGILSEYDRQTAENVERIYRLETANFTSDGFKKTYSPGMTAFSNSYPYGWDSMKPIWEAFNGQYRPTGTVTLIENGTGKPVPFIVFHSIDAGMETLAYYLQSHRPGNWFSTDLNNQLAYETKLAGIQPTFVNTLTV